MRLGGPTHMQLILDGKMPPLTDTEYYRGYSAGPSSSSFRPSPARVPSPVGGYSSPRTSPFGPSSASSSTRTSPIGPSRAPSPPLGPPGFPTTIPYSRSSGSHTTRTQWPPPPPPPSAWLRSVEDKKEEWFFGKNKKSRSSCFGSCNSCRIK